MKKVFTLIVLATALIVAGTTESDAQAVQWANMKDAQYLAKDSSLANSTTKLSQSITLFAKTGLQSTSTNYLHGARLLVMGRQTNDSLNAKIWLRVGQTGGTAGSNYGRFLVDSLQAGRKAANIDLSPYLVFPQLVVEVVGESAGNGFQAVWSALFGGAGKQTVER